MKKFTASTICRTFFGVVLIAIGLTGCTPELDWRELKPDGGRFAALMPEKFRLETKTLVGEPTVTMHLWTARAADAAFGVGYADYPAGISVPLERTMLDLAKNISGKIVLKRDVRIDGGSAGIEFQAEGTAGEHPRILRARLLRTEQRLYQLIVIAPAGRLSEDDFEMFFGAFRMTD